MNEETSTQPQRLTLRDLDLRADVGGGVVFEPNNEPLWFGAAYGKRTEVKDAHDRYAN